MKRNTSIRKTPEAIAECVREEPPRLTNDGRKLIAPDVQTAGQAMQEDTRKK